MYRYVTSTNCLTVSIIAAHSLYVLALCTFSLSVRSRSLYVLALCTFSLSVRFHSLYVFTLCLNSLQMRDAILNGAHPVTQQEAIMFAGFQCHIQYGPYNEAKHKPGFLE